MVGTKQGVWRTRSVRRKPIGDRWSRSNIDHIVGVPWLPNPGEGGDLEDVGGGVRVMDKDYRERIRQDENAHEAVPRSVFITKDDLEENGYTVGCPGCKAILRGTTRQLHSKACRKRLEEILQDTDKAKRAKKRMWAFAKNKEKQEKAKTDPEGVAEGQPSASATGE